MKRISISINKVVEELKDSQQNQYPHNVFNSQSLNKIKYCLANTSEGNIGIATGRLYLLVESNAVDGTIDIIEGKQEGWLKIKGLHQYEAWFFQYDSKRHELMPKLHHIYRSNKATLCFAHLIIHEDYELAKWYGDRLEKNFIDSRMGYWTDTPFEPFMVCLYHLWQGMPIMQGLPKTVDLDIYQNIVNYWKGPEDKLQMALIEACQYHMDRIDDPDGEYKEFCWGPYSLFPVEILAIMKIRRLLGMSIPEVDHELMKLPTANPPYPMPDVPDELFEKIRMTAKQYVPLDIESKENPSKLGSAIKRVMKKLKK